VVDGLAHGRHDIVVVMDADLQHPPERVRGDEFPPGDGGELPAAPRWPPAAADYYAFITREGHWSWGEREWRLFRRGEPAFQYSAGGAPLVQVYELYETNTAVYLGNVSDPSGFAKTGFTNASEQTV
jgi:glycosyltransferase involved in cell wall biosynthesis